MQWYHPPHPADFLSVSMTTAYLPRRLSYGSDAGTLMVVTGGLDLDRRMSNTKLLFEHLTNRLQAKAVIVELVDDDVRRQ